MQHNGFIDQEYQYAQERYQDEQEELKPVFKILGEDPCED